MQKILMIFYSTQVFVQGLKLGGENNICLPMVVFVRLQHEYSHCATYSYSVGFLGFSLPF